MTAPAAVWESLRIRGTGKWPYYGRPRGRGKKKTAREKGGGVYCERLQDRPGSGGERRLSLGGRKTGHPGAVKNGGQGGTD